MAKNLFGKSRNIDNPYAIYKGNTIFGKTEVRVLKTYQTKENEDKNQYARWFVAVKADWTCHSFDYGDSYIKEAIDGLSLVEATPEWKEVYG